MFIDIVYLKRHRKSSSPTRLTPAIVRHTIVFQHKFPHHTLLLVFKGRARRETQRGLFPSSPSLPFGREEPCRVRPRCKTPDTKNLEKCFEKVDN